MAAFYNEWDKYPAEWLKNLSAANLIAYGAVDERSIKSVAPEDVRGARQAHFFAGLGIWSYALRLAGVPDDFEVWSASLPCQPFSQAGRGKGFDDERHLLPDFLRLVGHCRPQCAIGEQSASPDGLEWLDALQVGFKGLGYTVGFAVLASASVGAPHIRHRVYWVAYSEKFGWPSGWNARPRTRLDEAWLEFERHGDARELADTYRERFPGERLLVPQREPRGDLPEASGGGETDGVVDAEGRGTPAAEQLGQRGGAFDAGSIDELADSVRAGWPEWRPEPGSGPAPWGGSAGGLGDAGSVRGGRHAGAVLGAEGGPDSGHGHQLGDAGEVELVGNASGEGLPEQLGERGVARAAERGDESPPTRGLWSDAIWLYCRDGRHRPTQSRVEQMASGHTRRVVAVPPLARGVQGRVGQIKAYGNAITSLVAATFIRAFMESTEHLEHSAR